MNRNLFLRVAALAAVVARGRELGGARGRLALLGGARAERGRDADPKTPGTASARHPMQDRPSHPFLGAGALQHPHKDVVLRLEQRWKALVDASTLEDGRSWMDWLFHCTPGSGFHSPLALSHLMLILSALCLIVGTVATAFEYKGDGEGMAWEPWMEKALLVCSVFGGTLIYVYDFLSDSMVVIGFAYCGFWIWMGCAVFIMVAAQLYSAYEFSHHGKDRLDRLKYFCLALAQCHILLDAYESWQAQRITASFARHKFIEAVWEAGPQAMLATYVIYYMDQNFNIFLVISIFGSICGLAYGISVWLQYSFEHQLQEDHIPPGVFTIRWWHHALWMCYFCMDFALRLLTIGLFLSLDNLRPFNLIIFVVLLLVYLLAVMIATHLYHTETGVEVWQISEDETVYVRRAVVAQRVVDGLVMTFFVHVLPADIRLAPKHPEESRLLFALHPDLRAKIMRTIIPIRAVEYCVLGFTSMWFRWDLTQCLALVAMFVTMHLLLYGVLRLKRPPEVLARQSTADISPELMRAISTAAATREDPKDP